MADDTHRNGKDAGKKSDDSGLGNLPPLSDFDSSGFQSDSNLPPLGSLDSDSGKGSAGGLPPISDLSVETPKPTGGNIKAPPAGFQMAEADFESPVFDTPAGKPAKARSGFQDPAADSDFSPETPEIGPGPDSDLDTPMFDSAFGAADNKGGFTPAFDTPAPTQAMETPMFGAAKAKGGEAPAFDEGAFMPGAAFDAGTPAPDFSPDTDVGAKPTAVTPAPVEKKKRTSIGGGGAKGALTTVLAAVICLVIGIGAGPFLSTKLTFIPNPLASVIADKEGEITRLNETINRMTKIPDTGGAKVSQEKINELLGQQERLTASVNDLTAKETESKGKLDKTTGELEQVRNDLEAKNEEFVKAQDGYEDLQNQTAIVKARQEGLGAEVERLTGLVGTQEEATERARAEKTTLLSNVEKLMIQIKEGMPLTPEKYAHAKRLAAVEDLKSKVELAKYVTPELLNDYTTLYQQELQIAASTAYFFARIPVTSRLGDRELKWAECLMKGNWAVYYRSLDGKNVGSYENMAGPDEVPQYGFRETLPEKIQKQIDAEVMASRGPNAEQELRALAEKQVISEGTVTPVQRVFNSL